MRDLRGRAALVAALVVMFAAAALPTSTAQVPVGGWTSPNVEWLGNVTLSGTPGAISGLVHEGYFYAEGLEAVEIFDISDPAAPRRTARIPLMSGPVPPLVGEPDVERNRFDTNGKLLITATSGPGWGPEDVASEGTALVYDVSDKQNPRQLGRVAGVGRILSCVHDCKWAYSTAGQIVDLRNPANPVVAGRWDTGLDFTSPVFYPGVANITEIAPGRVIVASTPIYLLDVRRPKRPRAIARSDGAPNSLGTVVWPRMGRDDIVLSVSQSFLGPRCEVQHELGGSSLDSAFKTWNASDWRSTGLITGIDEYWMENGTYTDGDPVISGAAPLAWGCGTTDVDAHPSFRTGGLAAVSGSGHGVKFLEVDKRGGVEEVGWFLPHANDTFGAYWITDKIVYTVDWPRGIDILRFDPNA